MDDEWHREDNELFADPTDILEANEPTSDSYTITQKSPETYLYSDESHQSSPLSDIPDSVGDNEHHEGDATPEDLLRMGTEKWSHLQLNQGKMNWIFNLQMLTLRDPTRIALQTLSLAFDSQLA